jgi:short-subunit dehydrogenase involved in D-alanine esterification of teichoic acids
MKKVVVITGTSTGIGFESVILFAQNGYKVIATMRANLVYSLPKMVCSFLNLIKSFPKMVFDFPKKRFFL